ncbi:DUF2075 domain-containing protein [Oenococcus kitaharae]|uniref:Schlafen group 3-like DNA/RNA helicase domain-containing protein n=1 Tax=Oenococcus kitaharae DSM 17330 TaxID=1045004 RepID=G9WGU3_9LACO|nr:DUF2075 domain-containing protein [Oenococcus kitaharae]EHN59351.1 hypothetical protein OKIT_1268 [Oenococcus kitaharae DSM 17330]OEY82139.1 ATP-dependent exonuclease [Oenococcus kitaharae]OEY82562.1 ATP-dependent exonuclease [Oenococcus kitaharae]OEY84817.1 ATP-dependent exonuclease [Oenococcus kitaharae]
MINPPIIKKIKYSEASIESLDDVLINSEEKHYIEDYPTVYVVNDKKDNAGRLNFDVYVGEANWIIQRTKQHLENANDKLQHLNSDAQIMIIGHDHFNKSMTLDIENRLINHMIGIDNVVSLNGRGNQQGTYFTSNLTGEIFNKIWRKMHLIEPELIPPLNVVRDSALFKASPFHNLSEEQRNDKNQIVAETEAALSRDEIGQLIIVEGAAGTGKTVLLSSLFYEFASHGGGEFSNSIINDARSFLLVNHDQQLTVYQQIAKKLNLSSKNKEVVYKPTVWLNYMENQPIADVALVDEAHLLWTQGKQAYRGKNQLDDIRKHARVVIAVFDKNQILRSEQHLSDESIAKLYVGAKVIKLNHQFRIHANENTIQWIDDFVEGTLTKIPKDDSYDLKIFDDPEKMYEQIKQKNQDQRFGLSRMLATFDWKYIENKEPENGGLWRVTVGDFSLPWNLELENKTNRKRNKGLSWAERDYTINEIGSTFTIQGFDLNYAGLIIGPSVKWRNGRLVFDRDASANHNAIKKRDGQDFSEQHLRNELNVLIKRGVRGLCIYAVDDELRNKLMSLTN